MKRLVAALRAEWARRAELRQERHALETLRLRVEANNLAVQLLVHERNRRALEAEAAAVSAVRPPTCGCRTALRIFN